jgi:hypothetical protein
MRFFEFITEIETDGLDDFVTMLQTAQGRYATKKDTSLLSWEAISAMAKNIGLPMFADPNKGYDTFKQLWDTNPRAKSLLDPIVKNFNASGIGFEVPVSNDKQQANTDDSEQAVDKMASGAAQDLVNQNQQTIQV